MQTQTQTQTKASAVKIGMVKIVALMMLLIGINAQAEVFTYVGFESQQDLAEKKGELTFPIKIVGVNSFVALLTFDYTKTTKYTKPTIYLQIPVDDNNVKFISIESYALTMYQLNLMADELGIKLDYCSQAIYHRVLSGEEYTITGNYTLCKNMGVVNLDHVINTVNYKMIRN